MSTTDTKAWSGPSEIVVRREPASRYAHRPGHPPATKGASDLGDPNPVDPEHVLQLMRANFPDKALRWVKDARWIGPVAVPTDRVDVDDEESWAASHEPQRVKHFAKRIRHGRPVKAGISVQEPGEDKIKVIDGHHRYLGSEKAGKPFVTYVGFVDSNGGPWDEAHAQQFHEGDDPANKELAADLVKVGPKGYVHNWIYVGPQAAGAKVTHPHHGTGTVTHHEGGKVHVAFDSGSTRSFDARHQAGAAGHFQERPKSAAAAFTDGQYRSMAPDAQWSDAKREQILAALRSTAQGKVLADTLDRFQDGGSIARLRSVIGKRLAGVELDSTSQARADAIIGALRGVPTDWAPEKLYRGMSVKGTVAAVLGKYKPGDSLDLNLTSFSRDRAVANRFQSMTRKDGATRVTVELVGDGKHLLPIQNLARDRRLFNEKEWVAGGRYEVVDSKKSPSGGVLLRIRQVAPL